MSFFFKKKSGPAPIENTTDTIETPITDDDVAVVISLALHLYTNKMTEYDASVVTIQKSINPYSPWSSKIHGLRQQPLRIPGFSIKNK